MAPLTELYIQLPNSFNILRPARSAENIAELRGYRLDNSSTSACAETRSLFAHDRSRSSRSFLSISDLVSAPYSSASHERPVNADLIRPSRPATSAELRATGEISLCRSPRTIRTSAGKRARSRVVPSPAQKTAAGQSPAATIHPAITNDLNN